MGDVTQRTLLEFIQDISRECQEKVPNSISDFREAERLTYLVREAYRDFVLENKVPRAYKVTQLTASGSSSLPTLMTLLDSFDDIDCIKYNKKTATANKDLFQDVYWRTPTEFMDMLNGRDSTASNVTQMTINNIDYNIYTDKHPSYYTTFDHEQFIFDSHYSSLDTTLMSSKTQVQGSFIESFTIADTFVVPVNFDTGQVLFRECVARAQSSIYKQPDTRAEIQARRAKSHAFNDYGRNKETKEDRVNYGRR